MCIPLFYRGSCSSRTRILASSLGLDLTTLACAHRRLALRYPHPVLSGNIHAQEERYGIEDPRASFALAHSHLAIGLNILLGTQRLCRSFLWASTLRLTTAFSDIPPFNYFLPDIAKVRRSPYLCESLHITSTCPSPSDAEIATRIWTLTRTTFTQGGFGLCAICDIAVSS